MGKLGILIILITAATTAVIGSDYLTPEELVSPEVLAEVTMTPATSAPPSPTPQLSPDPSPTPTPTPTPFPTPTPRSTPRSTPTPTVVPSPTPTPTSQSQASVNQTLVVTSSPTPISSPTPTPSAVVVPTYSSQQINEFISRFSTQYNVDPNILRHIALCESGFNPAARNLTYGGLYQFSASTWRSYRNRMHEDNQPELRFNAEEAVQTAAYVLSVNQAYIWPNCVP